MKKFLSDFGGCLLAGLLLPILLLAAGVLLPVDYVRYKRSRYYHDTGKRYTFFRGASPCCKLYNAIKAADLPIEYIECTSPETGASYEFFRYKDTLLLNDYAGIVFDNDRAMWTVEIEDEWVSLEKEIADVMAELRAAMGEDVCPKALVLIDRDELEEKDLPNAEQCPFLLLHDGDIAAALKTFVGT